MKKFTRILSFVLVVCLSLTCLWGCQASDAPETVATLAPTEPAETTTAPQELEIRDYVSELTLNMGSNSAKLEVELKSSVDGDTAYFFVPQELAESGYVKMRFLAIDTPESTGKIEEYGKAASNFTRERLENATSIIVESDDSQWNLDSTGTRYLAWIWYRTSDSEPYRNLNIEILQNGLAYGSSTANNRYGSTASAALSQGKAQKLNLYSGQKDPDFYYGDAVELTLKELRCHVEDYNGIKVAFNGVVTKRNGNGVYVESFDEETGMYNGMSVYYGFTLAGDGVAMLAVGNEVRIVGTVSYYEAGETYQVIGLSYRAMKPEDPNNIRKLSEGNAAAYVLTAPDTFVNGKVEVDGVSYDYADLAMATTLEMKGLKVLSATTTDDMESSSYGAITLSCEAEGVPVTVRTAVLRDENNDLITEDAFLGKTIDVKGIVDYFHGNHQIKVLSANDILITD